MLPSPARSTRSIALEARVRDGAEIEADAGAIEAQRVAAGTADHAPAAGAEALEERGVEQGEEVVVGAAVQNVEAAVAEKGVVALGAEHHVVAGRAGKRVVAEAAELGHRAGEVAAEHDVALAGVRIGRTSADDEIAETVAVDVISPSDGGATVVERIDAGKAKAVGAVERREIDAGIEPRGCAK